MSYIYMEWKPTDVTILFVYCWISKCFGPTDPSSGEFVQLFTQPLVQFLCRSVRVLCDNTQNTRTERHRYWTNGCVNSCTNSPEDGTVGPKHVEIQQYTNKIVTSVGFHSIFIIDLSRSFLLRMRNVSDKSCREKNAHFVFINFFPIKSYRLWYNVVWYMIYLTAIGLTPVGSSTVHIYTQTIHSKIHFTN